MIRLNGCSDSRRNRDFLPIDSLFRVLVHLRDNPLVPVFTGGGDTNLLSTKQEEAASDDRNKDNNM